MANTDTHKKRLSIMATYSEHIKENYPTLDRFDVQKLMKEHGVDNEENWADLHEELGELEFYPSAEIMGFLGY